MRLFSTEQVSKYHSDKYADQISDAILDRYIALDPNSRVAVETLVKDDVVIIAGEINSKAQKYFTEPPYIVHKSIVARVANKLGYKVSKVIDLIGQQSTEIHGAVDKDENIAAGDQGIMFGYATRETESKLPYGFDLANKIIKLIEDDVEFNDQTILLGDAKTQITVDLDEKPGPKQVKKIVISVCHCDSCQGYKITKTELRWYIGNLISNSGIELPELVEFIINPAGLWTVGGPTSDAGVTGRKIVCDQYGGYVPVGGGAFSGKDPSKVDRSASYAARQLAIDIIEQNPEINTALVQLAYAIGIEEPVSIHLELDNPKYEAEIKSKIKLKDYTPSAIIKRLNLTNVDGNSSYEKLAEGCHYYAG